MLSFQVYALNFLKSLIKLKWMTYQVANFLKMFCARLAVVFPSGGKLYIEFSDVVRKVCFQLIF